MNPLFFAVSLKHRVSYETVKRMADSIEQRGRIEFNEIDTVSPGLDHLIVDVHAAVIIDQINRGIIKQGEPSKVIPKNILHRRD